MALWALDDMRLRSFESETLFRAFSVDINGKWNEESLVPPHVGVDEPLQVDDAVIRRVASDGLRQIFRDTDSLASAGAGFHYVKPGRSHAAQFIRASQAVARTQHAYFVGAALLRILALEDGTRLFADTSGILPGLAATKDLASRLSPTPLCLDIDSFGGYEQYEIGLARITAADRIVISSSTSSSLAQLLIDQQIASSNELTTIFYLSEAMPDDQCGKILCDLTNRDPVVVESVRDARIKPIQSHGADDCDMCRSGSGTIELAGDAFFPVAANLRLRMLRLNDRPLDGRNERNGRPAIEFDGQKYFEDLYGTGAITVEPSRRSVSTSLEGLLLIEADEPPGVETLTEHISALVLNQPTVSAIYSLEDIDSQAMARFVAKRVFDGETKTVDRLIQPIEAPDADPLNLFGTVKEGTSLIVCAGVLASGRALLKINRQLRLLPDTVTTLYMIGAVHPESSSAWRIFESSLKRRSGASENRYRSGWQLPREPRGPGDQSAWDRERDVLGAIEGWLTADPTHRELRSTIARRLEQLDRLNESSLLLSNSAGTKSYKPIRPINPKFVLWPFDWTERVRLDGQSAPSQPEVVATVAHLMYHSRRTSPDVERNTASVRRQGYALSPAVFDRFNEPQIQAAILRSAVPGELDYHGDQDASRAMMDILFHVLANAPDEGGEAAAEFLLSIASGIVDPAGPGMKVTGSHLRSVMKKLELTGRHRLDPSLINQAMITYITSSSAYASRD